MNKIKKVSLFFKILFQILFIALPITLMIGWVNAPKPLVTLGGTINMSLIPHAYLPNETGPVILHTLSATEKMLGFLVSTIPLCIELFILYFLIKLFQLYEKGEIFSSKNVQYIRKIGYTLLIDQCINPFYQALMGVVLTLHNPPGHRFAAVTLDQTNMGILLTALLVILISWIMAEGCKLREEQQLTI